MYIAKFNCLKGRLNKEETVIISENPISLELLANHYNSDYRFVTVYDQYVEDDEVYNDEVMTLEMDYLLNFKS